MIGNIDAMKKIIEIHIWEIGEIDIYDVKQ